MNYIGISWCLSWTRRVEAARKKMFASAWQVWRPSNAFEIQRGVQESEVMQMLQIMMCTQKSMTVWLLMELIGTCGAELCLKFVYDWFNMSRFLCDSSLLHSGSSVCFFFGAILEMQAARPTLISQSSWAWDLVLFHNFIIVLAGHRWTRSRISQLEAANVRAAAQQTADSLLLQFQRQGRSCAEDVVTVDQTFAGPVQTDIFSASTCQ